MKVLPALLAFLTVAMPKTNNDSEMTKAALDFIATLSEEQRASTVFPHESADRKSWTYVPGHRKGISFNEMSEHQKTAAIRLLRVSLSDEGFDKVTKIRGLEPVLAALENGNRERDPGRYWFMFYGSPGNEGSWLWRYEGHHVSLSFAHTGGVIVSSTPQFLGSNPAEVKSGESKGLRILSKEQDLGFAFLESLDDDQRKRAVIDQDVPTDIVTASTREASIEGHLGVSYSDLSSEQKSKLLDLIVVYASVQTPGERKRRLQALKDEGYENLVFAWIGPISQSGRHYYRIQGKGFVIEFDNTQSDGNHIHTVWRDFKGDFGGDPLAEHYADGHHHRGE